MRLFFMTIILLNLIFVGIYLIKPSKAIVANEFRNLIKVDLEQISMDEDEFSLRDLTNLRHVSHLNTHTEWLFGSLIDNTKSNQPDREVNLTTDTFILNGEICLVAFYSKTDIRENVIWELGRTYCVPDSYVHILLNRFFN